MRPPLNRTPAPNETAAAELRRRGRFRCVALTCWIGESEYGRVLDLSAGGMRIKRRGRRRINEGETVTFDVVWDNLQATVEGRIVWVRKEGFCRYVIGVEFVNLTPETCEGISQLSRLSRDDAMIASVEPDRGRDAAIAS